MSVSRNIMTTGILFGIKQLRNMKAPTHQVFDPYPSSLDISPSSLVSILTATTKCTYRNFKFLFTQQLNVRVMISVGWVLPFMRLKKTRITFRGLATHLDELHIFKCI